MRARRSRLGNLLVAAALVAGIGCRRDSFDSGQLQAPENARPWRDGLKVAFDDRFTATPVRMEGRASHDVLDQRLLAARLGYADLVVRVTVEEVWARGRYGGSSQQYVDARLESVLLGKLPARASRYQRLEVRATDDLPADLPGTELLLFIRWAPDEATSFHHHLMPATDEILTLIDTMVAHAQANGVTFDGEAASKRKRRRRERKRAKDEQETRTENTEKRSTSGRETP